MVRFSLMIDATAEAVETRTVERADDCIITVEDVRARATEGIDFHLHLIYELMGRVQGGLQQGKPFSAADLDGIDEHLIILEGSHQEQKRHMPKPPENAWTLEQRARQRAAAQFTNVLRTRYRGCYQVKIDGVSSPSSPHTPPPRAKSA